MRETCALASRPLPRNRRRSLTTLLAMMLGLTTVLLFGGYIRDINYAMQTDFVKLTGHLQVQHRDYFRFGSGNPAAYGVKDYRRLLDTVRADPVLAPMLVVATPTLQFGAIAGNFAAGVSRPVLVTGVDVDGQNLMRQWNAYGQRVLSRPLSLSGTATDAAVIGVGVARVLQLCQPLKVPDCEGAPPPPAAAGLSPSAADGAAATLPPDIAGLADLGAAPAAAAPSASPSGPRIELLAASTRGAPNVAAVRVERAEFQGIKELDDAHVGLHLSQAQQLVFGAGEPQVTAIAIQLKQTSQMQAARERLTQLLASDFAAQPLAVVDYEVLNPFYGQTLAMFAAIFGFISVLISAIVLFTVSNTMSMAVVERTVEIGTLRAIGLRQKGIRAMFLTEGIVLGCFGAVLGILAALALAEGINGLGLTWIPPGRVEHVALAVRLTGENALMLANAAGLIVVAALSALLPATRAARMNIVDALRHV